MDAVQLDGGRQGFLDWLLEDETVTVAATGLLLGVDPDDLIEEESSFRRTYLQAIIEKARQLEEQRMKAQAVLIANHVGRLFRRS